MKKHNVFLVCAGVFITIADFVIYQFYTEKKEYFSLRPWYVFFWTLAVGLIGYAAWKKYPVKWPKVIWVFAYSSYLLYFFIVMFTNSFVYSMPTNVVNSIWAIWKFPNGPLPLLILYFLVRYFPSKNSSVGLGDQKDD